MNNQPSLVFYGLAGLVFLLGIGDFYMYMTQTYGNIQEGMTDLFALTGLAIWWIVAAGIAYVGYMKAHQPAPVAAAPDVEITFEENQETGQPTNQV
jgi:hypothetical protein